VNRSPCRALALALAVALVPALAACSTPPEERATVLPGELADLAGRELSVGFLIVDGVYNTEVMAPFDIFQHTIFHVDPGMRVFTVAPSTRPVTTFEGLRILPDYSFADAPPIDVLVVASAEHSMDTDLENRAMMDFVRRAGSEASYLVSLCDGAFVLAAAGLLDGLEVTTHHGSLEALQIMAPSAKVLENRRFVDTGSILTCAGVSAGIDMSLWLTGQIFDPAHARNTQRMMQYDPAPPYTAEV